MKTARGSQTLDARHICSDFPVGAAGSTSGSGRSHRHQVLRASWGGFPEIETAICQSNSAGRFLTMIQEFSASRKPAETRWLARLEISPGHRWEGRERAGPILVPRVPGDTRQWSHELF